MFQIKPNHFYAMRIRLPEQPFNTPTPLSGQFPLQPTFHYGPHLFKGVTTLTANGPADFNGVIRIVLILSVHGDQLSFLTCTGDYEEGKLSKKYPHRYLPLVSAPRLEYQSDFKLESVDANCDFGYINFTTPLVGIAVKFEHPIQKDLLITQLPTSGLGARIVTNQKIIKGEIVATDVFSVGDECIGGLSLMNSRYHEGARWNRDGSESELNIKETEFKHEPSTSSITRNEGLINLL